jgi:hypothetical protein
MYPTEELNRLGAQKVVLQSRIAVRRLECAVALVEIARPIAAIDRGMETWRRFAPFLKLLGVPLGLLLTRIVTRKRKGKPAGKSKFAAFMTALPIIIRGINLAKQAFATPGARPSVRSPDRAPL